MSDQKLLELAAKAAGIKYADYAYDVNDGLWIELTLAERKLTTICAPTGWHWNPLEDDVDAFRLAVKLGISIPTPITDQFYANHHLCGTIKEVGNDAYAATRRAIVRAAAEIGRSM